MLRRLVETSATAARACRGPGPAQTKTARKQLWLAAASTCLGLALCCRVSLLYALACTAFALLFLERPRDRRWTTLAQRALALGGPLALAGGGLGLYNYLRFSDPFEFGTRFQTTTMSYWTDSRFWLPNLYSYLLRPLVWNCTFPWLHANVPAADALPSSLQGRTGYMVWEQLAGTLRTTPFGLLLLAPPLLWLQQRVRRGGTRSPLLGRPLLVLQLAFLGASLALLPALGLWQASLRYLEDVVGGLVLAATLAGWALFGWASQQRRWQRWLTRAGYYGSALVTIGFGVLLGFEGYLDHYRTNNPGFAALAESLSCEP